MLRKKEYEKKNKDEKNKDNSIIQDGASDSLHNVSNALYDSYMLFANSLQFLKNLEELLLIKNKLKLEFLPVYQHWFV